MSKQSQQVNEQYIMVPAEHAGRRIDNFLFSRLKGVPKSLIYRLLRKRAIRVNKKRAGADYRLQSGDQIRVPALTVAAPASAAIVADSQLLAQLRQAVLLENSELLIIDKPSGLAVHGGSGIRCGLIEMLQQARPTLTFLALAHRLDRETSGCLLFAKTPQVLRELHALLRQGQVKKRYQALTLGQWPAGITEVSLPLRRNQLQSGERMVKVDDSGKASITRFRSLECWENATLVEAELLTGRTHQIRVHGSHIGHPIAGDSKYGDRDFNRMLRQCGLKRLFLHAAALEFYLPSLQTTISATAPLPVTLTDCLAAL
ncbi:MAG: RluA family pseudouridine synthase [Gammaproteobacteria bacterium]|nr:RluA family pseudouridine synthase [Gammaproteobacteria bacterium]